MGLGLIIEEEMLEPSLEPARAQAQGAGPHFLCHIQSQAYLSPSTSSHPDPEGRASGQLSSEGEKRMRELKLF